MTPIQQLRLWMKLIFKLSLYIIVISIWVYYPPVSMGYYHFLSHFPIFIKWIIINFFILCIILNSVWNTFEIYITIVSN